MAYEVFNMYWPTRGRVYETLEEIVHAFWMEFSCGLREDFRVIDTYDRQRIDIERVKEVFHRIRRERFETWYKRGRSNYEFRNGPVPCIRKRRIRGGYSRHPATLQSRREEAFLEIDDDLEDVKVKIRASRRDLPTSWDDVESSAWRDRSWKTYRKTQYKAKAD